MSHKPLILLTKEKHLINGCMEGCRASQSALYKQYASTMMVVCLRYSKNREEAEEILQDGFMKVFKFIYQFKNTGSFEGWMRKIFVNCALQKYRNQLHMHPIISLDNHTVEQTYSHEIFTQLDARELLRLVQRLPPGYRMVFNLYVFEGMRHREIAELLDISEGTSKSNLSDARAILRKSIGQKIRLIK